MPLIHDHSLFGAPTSKEKVNEGLLKSNLFTFHHIIVAKEYMKSLLVWWNPIFPSVGFLA
jgi:hypothetical protein